LDKEGEERQVYLSGTIELHGKRGNLVLFKNQNIRTEDDPDYSSYVATKLKSKKGASRTESEGLGEKTRYRY
jgi:hypothetical protein